MMLSTRCWTFKSGLFNSFHSFPQMLLNPVGIVKLKQRRIYYIQHIVTYGWLFYMILPPRVSFLDVNVEGSSLRQGQASTCQDAWWLTWNQLSPDAFEQSIFFLSVSVFLGIWCCWLLTESTLRIHVFNDRLLEKRWVLETRWLMKFALVRTASCSILSNWLVARKTPPTILPGALHHRKRDCGSCLGQDPKIGR